MRRVNQRVGKPSMMFQEVNQRKQLLEVYLESPDLQVRFGDWVALIHLEIILKEHVVQSIRGDRMITFGSHFDARQRSNKQDRETIADGSLFN